jgi:mRNA interferase RelE/StbE
MLLDITRQAKNFLDQLDAKQFRQIGRKILDLMDDPKPGDARPLRGYPFMRVDAGEYRIVYRIEDNILRIALIDKRNDDEVYKKLERSKN